MFKQGTRKGKSLIYPEAEAPTQIFLHSEGVQWRTMTRDVNLMLMIQVT